MKYKAVYDIGKPYEEEYSSYEQLKRGLLKYYLEYYEDEVGDVYVYDESGKDISESQFVEELVGEILKDADRL